MWAGSHAFFLLAGVPPLTHAQAPAGQLIVPLLVLTARVLPDQLRTDCRRHRSRRPALAVGCLARALPLALGELLRGRVGLVLPRAADVPGEPSGGDRLSAAARGAPPDPAVVVRAPRRRAAASCASGSAVSVDGRNARHGDRRQRRRDAQPRAPRAGVRARARPRARRHGRTDAERHRGGCAAARHGQARRARAHPEQAGQAAPRPSSSR